MSSIPPDMAPDDDELRVVVHFLVQAELRRRGYRPGITRLVPEVGSAAWWAAPDEMKVAALLPLAERWLALDPDRMVLDRLKAMSCDLSEAMRGRHGGPSHVELERRRAEPGPNARSVDRGSLACWVSTGCSDGGEVPAA